MEIDQTDDMQDTSGKQIVPSGSTTRETTIAELKPTSYDKILEARVYRKWISTTYSKKNESGAPVKKVENAFCCILIDKEGNAIQANMNLKEADYFNSKMNLGSVYRISDFRCEPTNPYQQTIDNKTSLRFGRITKFDNATTTDIPHHYFRFVSYSELSSRIPQQDATGRMEYPILTDYMGSLRSLGELDRKGGPNEDATIFRKLDIENLNGDVVELTLWDKMAKSLDDAQLETMDQPVIVAVSSCRVSRYIDYQLTATSATYCYLNPQIPEVDEARAQYKQKHQANPPLRICKTPYEDVEKEMFRNRFPLKTLLKQTPKTYRGVKFTTDATVTAIDIKRDWFYMSCAECNLKVRDEDGIYRCLDHGKQSHPTYRYNFKGFITDPSATAAVTFFSPAGDQITGYSCLELLAKHKAEDLQEIPPEIFAIEGKRNVFQIHFNTTSRTTDFVVDKVFDKNKPGEEPSKLIDANPGTPPTPLLLTTEQDLQQKKDEESGRKTSKRPLFQDESATTKKQKGTPESSKAEKPATTVETPPTEKQLH